MYKLRGVIFFSLTLLGSSAFAAAYQIFPTLAYDNPATLNTTGKVTAILGATDIDVRMKYMGSVGSQSGSALSSTNTLLPYFRAAYRVDPKWVVSFDISHPALANISYPATSIVSPVVINTIIKDTNYSPKFSYQMNDTLAIGLGFDVNEISDAQPNFGGPPLGKMVNKSAGLNYGWDTGLAYKLNKTNFLSVSYYSEIKFDHLAGYSQQGPVYQPNFSDNITFPATWTLNLVHQPTSLWTIVETVRYIQWSVEQDLTLTNSAGGNISLPLNYNDSWSALLGTRYQLFEHWGLGLAAEYQSNPQSTTFRPIALPTASLVILGASIDYALSSQWTAKLQYAYGFTNPEINRTTPVVQQGHINIGVNILDLGLTWKV